MLLSGVIAVSAAAIINLIPANTASAQDAAAAFGNGGGMSSFLSALGNSYDVREVESELMGCVVEKAAELDIEFDITQFQDEYENFAIAKVSDYLNVRSEASTDGEIVGHMYNGSVCEILERVEGQDGIWFKVVSGSVEGYVKSDYFIYGDSALEVIGDYVSKVAVVQCNFLNVRADADINSSIIGSVAGGDKLDLFIEEDIVETEVETVDANKTETVETNGIETDDAENIDEIAADVEEEIQWVKVYYTSEKVGYVSAEYVVIEEDYVCAKTIEEERAEAAAKAEAEKKRQEQAAAAAAASKVEDTTRVAPNTTYADVSELRQNIVDYAKQFEGIRYVMGGSSLTTGTDCSGFTMYIYAAFGYTIGRTPSSQWANAGRLIATEELQPGDLVCMGTSSCYHVAIYIGDGLIVHEANSRQGCIISGLYNFEPILGFKSIVD